MAERLFIRILESRQEDLSQWQVTSAGTWARDGIPPDEKLISTMEEYGIDIRDHRSRMLDESIIADQDLILVMENSHREALEFEFPQKKEKVLLLSEMMGQNFDIVDPFSKDQEMYLRIARQIDTILSQGYQKIKESIRPGNR